MGILAEPLKWLVELCDGRPKGYAVCELGDQYITCLAPHQLAKEFYEGMNCGRYESIDGNGRGTITLDLNHKLPPELHGQFDIVTDFGTGEHVFNQFQVWRILHQLVKVNGHIVFDRPTQGYHVHCYYNTNRCLFDDLAAANGYKVVHIGHCNTSRGELIRGVWQRTRSDKFVVPQQGRYKKLLRPITSAPRS